MSNTKNEPDICRVCGGQNLRYDDMFIDFDCAVYAWLCRDCKSEGRECYELKFISNDVTFTGTVQHKQ